MRRIFSYLWRFITSPFRLLVWLVKLPSRAVRNLHEFLTYVPPDRPVVDVFSTALQSGEGILFHIEALRKHLFRALLILALAVVASFTFTRNLINFLAQPVGGLNSLRAIEVTESIGVFMRVALISGVAVALPYIAFEMWLFAAPGLMPTPRKFGLIGIPLATILFISGMVFAYYVMLPAALPFLTHFMGIQAELRPQSYFNFVTGIMFWIGVAFEFPLIVYVLTAIGFIKPAMMAHQWRLAIVLIAVISAAITPTVDPVNMALVMLPMVLLYFISIGLSHIAYAGRKQTSPAC